MPLDEIQRILKTIQIKKHILITCAHNPSADAIASALALHQLLKKTGKKTDIVINNGARAKSNVCAFLPEYKNIKTSIERNKDILLEFDIGDAQIQALTYKIKNNKLSIRLFTEEPNLQLSAPRAKKEHYPYDLIITIGCNGMDLLGRIYDEHAEFFYHTPIINIDHSSENDHFGELNLVEMTSVATAEIIFMLFEAIDKSLLDEKISTCLLTGIIHESRSFQSGAITPRSLAIASELMSLGADRGLIIQNLFYNKNLGALQLWGRILAHLSIDEQGDIAYSTISENDFLETDTNEKHVYDIIDDLFTHAPETKLVVLLYEQEGYLKAMAHTNEPSLDLRRCLARFSARGTRSFVECQLYAKKEKDAIALIRDAALGE